MSVLTQIGNKIFRTLEMAGRAKTLAHLETLSDRTLKDLGFSRTLMRQGPSAWPWKVQPEVSATAPNMDTVAIDQAVQELNTYNDHELADLGLVRDDIQHAVTHGCPAVDHGRAA